MQHLWRVKIRTTESIRRYSFPQAPTWDVFKAHVISQIIQTNSNIPPPELILRLEYIDDENDTVTISSEEEWKEMINQKQNGSLVTIFLRGWENVPKEVIVRPEINIEELMRREEQTLQEIQRKLDLKLKERLEEEKKRQDEEELKRLEEEKKLLAEEEQKRITEELKYFEEIQLKEAALRFQEEERKRQERIKRHEEKLKLKEEAKRRAEEIKRKGEEIKRKVEELKQEKKRRDEQKREEERIKEEKRQKAAALHQQNSIQIKKYESQLAKLHELGFREHKRNLHLLMTFNGNIDSVLDNLLAQ